MAHNNGTLASLRASLLAEQAPPITPDSRPSDVSKAPMNQENEQPVTVPAPKPIAAPQSKKPDSGSRKGMRTKKEKPGDSSGRRKPDTANKVQTNFYISADNKQELQIASIMTKTPMSVIIEDAVVDRLANTYECNNPACHARFVAASNFEGIAQVPVCCPFCSQNGLTRIKYT